MLRTDEDALICDFAEYYHVLDLRSLPPTLAATLFLGLRDDSRCRMKLGNRGASTYQLMLSMIYDCCNWLCWAQTEDAAHGRHRPKSLHDQLIQKDSEKVRGYRSAEDFEEALEEARNG